MITIDQFFTKYNGCYIDYDKAWGFQCVDLMRQYCADVRGVNGYIAIPQRGNAKDIFRNFTDNKYFKKVLNGPSNAPKTGDIIFFSTYPFIYGWSGHVAIVSSADAMNLVVFEQNYPTNSPCKFGKHSYRGCMGWLSPR